MNDLGGGNEAEVYANACIMIKNFRSISMVSITLIPT